MSIRYRSEKEVSGRHLIGVDPKLFAIWELGNDPLIIVEYKTTE